MSNPHPTKNPKEIPPELLEHYSKNNPHDLLTKTVLSDMEIARFYLQTHIPKHLKGKLDWSKNLTIEDIPLIDEHLDVGRNSQEKPNKKRV